MNVFLKRLVGKTKFQGVNYEAPIIIKEEKT